MTSSIPAWQPFELYGGWVPPVLELDAGRDPVEGRIVAVSPTRSVRDRGWAARAAVEMARGWAAQGARVFLADLSVHDPEIHAVLEAENEEGVVDSLLYGASIQRVARPADDGAFFVATAGSAVADASQVLTHPRWTGMTHGFMTAGVTLVLYLPIGLEGSETLARRATHRVVLARPGEVLEEVEQDEGPTVVAVLGPDGTMGEFMDPPLAHAPPVAVGAGGFDDPLVRDPLSADGYAGGSGEGAAVATVDGVSATPDTAPVPDGDPGVDAPRRSSSPAVVVVALLVTAMVVAVALAFLGVIRLPFLSAAPGGDAPVVELATTSAAEAESGTPSRQDVAGSEQESVVVTSEGAVAEPGSVTLVTDLDAPAGGSTLTAVAAGTTDGSAAEDADGTDSGASSAGEAEPETPAFTYSLSLSAWETLPAALEHARQWERRRPGRHFVVAPILSGGQLFFRVLAGPAASPGVAEELRADLGRGVGTAEAAGWILRRTPLAYLLEQTPDRDSAEALVRDLEDGGIPAYVLVAADGAGYRVYAGAYGRAEDAQALENLLRDRGITPLQLTERTGRLPG